MKIQPSDVALIITTIIWLLSFGVLIGRIYNTREIEQRCLSYFQHTFQSFDLAPEACDHIVKGEPMKPYVFGSEPVSPSSH